MHATVHLQLDAVFDNLSDGSFAWSLTSVLALSGITYDKPAIMRWIEQHRRDPTTGHRLKSHHLNPNLSLRNIIQAWVDQHQ